MRNDLREGLQYGLNLSSGSSLEVVNRYNSEHITEVIEDVFRPDLYCSGRDKGADTDEFHRSRLLGLFS